VVEPRDAHLCCGSAGTYNLMQPEISAELKARKVATLEERRRPR
jgi:glycolate oxidase iron-sulfur subunit